MGLKRLGMFDFIGPALIAGSVGIAYLWLVAPRILPKRELPLANTSPRVFSAYLAITEASPMVGQMLSAALQKTDGAMKVKSVERGRSKFMLPLPSLVLKAGDHLVMFVLLI